jgi:methyl-accepting chemotaxis protein
MNPLKKLPLSLQLYLLVALVMTVMGAALALTVMDLRTSSRLLSYTVANRLVPTQDLNAVMDAFQAARDGGNAVVNGSKTPEAVLEKIGPMLDSTHEAWARFAATTKSADEKALFDEASGPVDAAYAASSELVNRLRSKQLTGLDEFRENTHLPSLAAARVELRKLTDIQVVNAKADEADAEASYKSTLRSLLLVTLAAVILAIGAAIAVIRSTMGRLGSDPAIVRGIASRIAGGELMFDIPASQGRDDSLVGDLRKMKGNLLNSKLDYEGQLNAISGQQAVIEFTPDGNIVKANANLLQALGYSPEQIAGKHHSMFVDPAERNSAQYRSLWTDLGNGKPHAGTFRRLHSSGRVVWIQGVYVPILGVDGKPFKVVKYANDVTEARNQAVLNSAFRGALDKLDANVTVADAENEIIFVSPAARQTLGRAQSELRKELPDFDVERLRGSRVDVMTKEPTLLRSQISELKGTLSREEVIGGRTMKSVLNPMTDEGGRRLGTVIEWFDRTQEVATERELQDIITAVTAGDLQQRISLTGKTGVFEAVSRGINELVENVDTLAREIQTLVTHANSGDLTSRIVTEGRAGLLVKLGTGINQLTHNMAQVVSNVKRAAAEVSRGADEISHGNVNLSQRTEQQASSLEETASSMEEMTSTVKQNADNAGQANQLAAAARDQAEKGGVVVSRAVTAMAGINESSRKIADIIGVIDDIAFQTNLLALNAAVEAARAGEQGRGFAVVASEVRNLAGRSATAAKEIKALIQDSVHRVEEGSSLVTQSGATLDQIVSAVKKVSDIVAEIAAASHEQSAGIEQVNKAVMQLDELTQQNASLVEEASAASQAMAEQARNLNDSMQEYTVATDDGTPVAPAASAERRKATRPWSPRKPAAQAPARAATPVRAKVVASAGSDSTWSEF